MPSSCEWVVALSWQVAVGACFKNDGNTVRDRDATSHGRTTASWWLEREWRRSRPTAHGHASLLSFYFEGSCIIFELHYN